MKILVTGAAGFIGAAVCASLLKRGDSVIGMDNLNDYYDVNLKLARLRQLENSSNFKFIRSDITDNKICTQIFKDEQPQRVVHLAAQAGVRYSIENPHAYIKSNIEGFLNILEACRHNKVEHLVYASSSSVYGANTQMPFSIHHNVDHPCSLYGATKKSNELMAHAYSHLYDLPTTGLRFFTVYGPWGRPDMSLFLFTKKIMNDEPIDVFNNGQHSRDFTYIDDIVNGVVNVVDTIAAPEPEWDGKNPDPGTSLAPFRLYNIGNNNPVELLKFIEVIEACTGKKAEKNYLPMQAGDVPATYADVDDLIKDVNFSPNTPIEIGVKNFINWYVDYYK